MKKRYIEYDLPLQEISHYSAKEKYVSKGHPCALHPWWARRPLASSRATIFAALIDLPETSLERKKINKLIKRIVPWDAVKDGNNSFVKRAQSMIGKQWHKPPKLYDPFAGGGSIPLEALRLGCDTYASDYNPVAVLIEKATLEWSQKFGRKIVVGQNVKQPRVLANENRSNLLSYMVKKWTDIIGESVRKEIGKFYPNEPYGYVPVGYIWARTIPCHNPECGAEIPLIRQFWLVRKKDRLIAYKPRVNKKTKRIDFIIQQDEEIDFNPSEGIITRSNAMCPICKQVMKANDIRKFALQGKMGARMIVVVLNHPKKTGKKYRLAKKIDVDIYNEAKQFLEKKIENWTWLETPLPDEQLPYLRSIFNVHVYGIRTWRDLFNPRQQLALVTFLDNIKKRTEEIEKDCKKLISNIPNIDGKELTKAVIGCVGLIFSNFCNRMSAICYWFAQGEKIQPTFSRPALPMVWDFVELNPFSGSSGCWFSRVTDVLRYIENNGENKSARSIMISSATKLGFPDSFFDAVLTDPPYYDNIPYANLSDFFYVWLKRCIGDFFPDFFSTPLSPKQDEIVQLAERNKSYSYKTKDFFEENLTKSFQEINRVLKPGGIAVIVYAHKTTAAWETMLNSLLKAELVITASWPIHTEMSSRLRAKASAALASSIYMVCRKLEREKIGFYNEIKPEIRNRIEEKLQQFWNEGIAGGDFFISAIGPGVEVFSKYKVVETYSGKQVSTSELLGFIRSVAIDFVINRLLKDASPTKIDKQSQFYLAYRWTYLDNTIVFDDARKLASAMGVNLEELWKEGGFVNKKTKYIQVLGPKDRGITNNIRNMVDAMHNAVLLWEQGKMEDLRSFLTKTGYGNSGAFWQFCQAVALSLLQGNKEKQLLEGLLVGKDRYTSRKIEDIRQKRLEEFGEEV